ncbi:hypothetical protein KAX02_00330 [candidate division WOR-3 bacterium]|nr:hypothetical protein [candidate division WOR-3 bacterium]
MHYQGNVCLTVGWHSRYKFYWSACQPCLSAGGKEIEVKIRLPRSSPNYRWMVDSLAMTRTSPFQISIKIGEIL